MRRKTLDEVWEKLTSTVAKPVKLIQEDICLLMDVINAYITSTLLMLKLWI